MDVRRLVLFAAVVEHGSLSQAAATLHLSQPSLSRQIAGLEREAGVRLLNRLPTGVTPTTAGAQLLRRARAIRAHHDAAERELSNLRESRAGELRLAAFPTAAATLVLDALVELRATHPGLAVSVEERDRRAALDAVMTGGVDIALTFTDLDADPAEDLLDTEALLEDPMLLALPAGHPLAHGDPPTLGALRDADWIAGIDHRSPGLIVRACLAAGFEPRIVARLDHQPAIQAAVAARLGVTLIPALAARRPHPGLVLRMLAPPAPVRRVLAHTLTDPRSPATAAGMRALRTAAGFHVPAKTRPTPGARHRQGA